MLRPQVTGGLLRMRQEAYRNGAVVAKYKPLLAMAFSIANRCESCSRAYVKMVCHKDVPQGELIECLEVAMTMQGCPGEEWALKAYAAYKECIDGRSGLETPACCKNHDGSQTDKEGA